MPETLAYEAYDGSPINEVIFSRTIKNIPSKATSIFIKSQSTTVTFRGRALVSPTDGKSHSGDLSISDTGDIWSKALDIVIPPLERYELKMRAIPVSTPANTTGGARIVITGAWE